METCPPGCTCSASPKAEPVEKPIGCLLILKNGRRIVMNGLSITQAKRMRRQKDAGVIKVAGKTEVIAGHEIKEILPMPTTKMSVERK